MSSTSFAGGLVWLAMNCSTRTLFKATTSERVARFSRRSGCSPNSSRLPTAVCSGSCRRALWLFRSHSHNTTCTVVGPTKSRIRARSCPASGIVQGCRDCLESPL